MEKKDLTGYVPNVWIRLSEKKNGADVERSFASINAIVQKPVNGNSSVVICEIGYWQRELYPDGTESKCSMGTYTLQNLGYTEWIDKDAQGNDVTEYKDELLVLNTFITNLGLPYIVNPARGTISDVSKIPLTHRERIALHDDIREVKIKSNN